MIATSRVLTHIQIESLPHFRKKTAKEYSAACPFCGEGEDRFLYWPENGRYWCRHCDAKGFIGGKAEYDPARIAALQAQRRAEEKAKAQRVNELKKGLESKAGYYHSKADQAREYWRSQGLTNETIDRYQLGFADIADNKFTVRASYMSYTIPYPENGKVVSIRHRLKGKKRDKYRPEFAGLRNRVFNADRLNRTDSFMPANQVVLVEGEIKAMVLDQAGFRVVAIPGATPGRACLKELVEKLAPFDSILIALDPGQEMHSREKIAPLFKGGGVIVSDLHGKPDDLIVLEDWTPRRLYSFMLAGEDVTPQTFENPPRLQVKPYGPPKATRERRAEILVEAKQDRQAKQATKEARQAEIDRRWQAGNIIAFLGDEEIDPDQVEYMRSRFSNASKWHEYVAKTWPDLDSQQQYKIKLAENREMKRANCGEFRKQVLPSGKARTYRWTCGLCDECQKRNIAFYRRALNEIMGIVPGSSAPLYDLESLEEVEPEPAPRENAPPLARIKGDLSIMRIGGDTIERLKLTRELRTNGILYRFLPVEVEGRLHFDVITNDDRGDPLGPFATDERLSLWVRGYEGKRASGKLLPSLKKLQERYRRALPYEVVMPELDDEGQPVDPDIFALDLPDIGTRQTLPAIALDFKVYDRETLQAALYEINREQLKILARRGSVNYSVYIKKRFYTRYSTSDSMIEQFNRWQDRLRRKKGLPVLG